MVSKISSLNNKNWYPKVQVWTIRLVTKNSECNRLNAELEPHMTIWKVEKKNWPFGRIICSKVWNLKKYTIVFEIAEYRETLRLCKGKQKIHEFTAKITKKYCLVESQGLKTVSFSIIQV